MAKPVEYCGLECGCFIPGDGVGTRRCRLEHWNERTPHKLPRLGIDLKVEKPFECKRKTKGDIMEKKTVAHYPSYKLGTFKKGFVEPGRNKPCRCGSGKKFKHCCLDKQEAGIRAKVVEASKTTEKEAK